MFTILPFETEYFRKHQIDVNYIGNPLLDSIEQFKINAPSREEFLQKNNLDDRPIVALLAGSRLHEIKKTLPVMKKAATCYPEFQFVIAGVNYVKPETYEKSGAGMAIPVLYNQTYPLLSHAHTALVTSGTATLETALFEVPQTVVYKFEGGWLLHVIMKKFFLKVKWVSLPNLILNKEAIKEYLQKDMTFKNIKQELHRLFYEKNYRKKIMADYRILKQSMGNAGSSARAA